MTTSAEKFKKTLLVKTHEKDQNFRTQHIKNIIVLRENFVCNIYYLSSNSTKGFWNFSDNQIAELKSSKNGNPFLVVFLRSTEMGYVMSREDIEKCSRDLTIVKDYYKITEEYIERRNISVFRTLEEFIDLLSPYRKNK